MRSTQKAKQEVAIGNISSKFFRLRISKTTLLMNPIVILLKPIQSISFFFFFSFLVLLFPQGQNFLRFLACDRLEKKNLNIKPFMIFFSLIFIGICCWVQSLLNLDYLSIHTADVNIESPPSMHPCKRICDITGFEVCGCVYWEAVLEFGSRMLSRIISCMLMNDKTNNIVSIGFGIFPWVN